MAELGAPRHPASNASEASANALHNALPLSPYLSRLARQRAQTAAKLAKGEADQILASALERIQNLPTDLGVSEALRILRQAKADTHLALASLDLSLEWDWEQITYAWSEFADAACQAALRGACHMAAEKKWIDWNDLYAPLPGIFVMALGKLGAHELNYSSDIDIAAFYDPEIFPASGRSASDAAARIIRDMTMRLETLTEHGYVLRVDHRLRPDPLSTPLAVSTIAAEKYYESIGQNWERMAWIKGRYCAGDPSAAEAFNQMMKPFVWRRHLDFWAIEDIRAIKGQIHSEGGHKGLEDPAFDVKLGRGGIREIEFYAQTQQLILGGRHPELRSPVTVKALDALAQAGAITEETSAELKRHYAWLRAIEHRIQMINDEHTHTLPASEDGRDRIAALSGFETLKPFDADMRTVRQSVHTIFSDLFEQEERVASVGGNLVFTGVDDDPETLETLKRLGFSSPSDITSIMRKWHSGGIRATRNQRGRQILTTLEPALFKALSESGNTDAAFSGMKRFFEGLSSGVQALSLLLSHPELLSDLIAVFAIAPRLAEDLGRRPTLLEAMLEGGFGSAETDDPCGFLAEIKDIRDKTDLDLETAMNEVRQRFRDEHFRIRYQLVRGGLNVRQSEDAFTRLANACCKALIPHVEADVCRKLGPVPGRWVICGLGKLGSSQMTATSDLDLMVIYDPEAGATSATTFFTRATQRFIAALSAETEEGRLYEADMQLRPSGSAGPVAVKLSAFERYYESDAWTWEFMALTRLRVIAGDEALAKTVETLKENILSTTRDDAKLTLDVLDMRRRLAKERPAKSVWDMKLSNGSMVDVEFITQYLQLLHGDQVWPSRATTAVLDHSAEKGLIDRELAEQLISAYRDQSNLQGLLRVTLGDGAPKEPIASAVLKRIERALAISNDTPLLGWLDQSREHVIAAFSKIIGKHPTES